MEIAVRLVGIFLCLQLSLLSPLFCSIFLFVLSFYFLWWVSVCKQVLFVIIKFCDRKNVVISYLKMQPCYGFSVFLLRVVKLPIILRTHFLFTLALLDNSSDFVFHRQTQMSVLITHAVMADRVQMVSTVTPASASQDLLEIVVRLVSLFVVINNISFITSLLFLL